MSWHYKGSWGCQCAAFLSRLLYTKFPSQSEHPVKGQDLPREDFNMDCKGAPSLAVSLEYGTSLPRITPSLTRLYLGIHVWLCIWKWESGRECWWLRADGQGLCADSLAAHHLLSCLRSCRKNAHFVALKRNTAKSKNPCRNYCAVYIQETKQETKKRLCHSLQELVPGYWRKRGTFPSATVHRLYLQYLPSLFFSMCKQMGGFLSN